MLTVFATATVASCFAAIADGSTKTKAIPLKQRDPAKAVEEEIAWMLTVIFLAIDCRIIAHLSFASIATSN
jgi:hypothetical protein